jgi:hypothetical protein
MPLDLFNDVFLLYFTFEPSQSAFERLAILQMDFCQLKIHHLPGTFSIAEEAFCSSILVANFEFGNIERYLVQPGVHAVQLRLDLIEAFFNEIEPLVVQNQRRYGYTRSAGGRRY